jgi:hypothetical protein
VAGEWSNRGAKRAREARAELGYARTGPLPDVLEAIEGRGGAHAVLLDLPPLVAGAFIARPGLPLLLVNGRQALARQRFTLAHEFGHQRMGHASVVDEQRAISGLLEGDRHERPAISGLLEGDRHERPAISGLLEGDRHERPAISGRLEGDRYERPAISGRLEGDRDEVCANAFAAEFLMPRDAVLAWGTEHVRGPVTLEHVVLLAHEYGVSAQAARYALATAGVLGDRSRARQLDDEIIASVHFELARWLGLQPLDDGLADAAAALPRIPAALRDTALGDFLAGAIGAEELARRLGAEPERVRAMLRDLGLDRLPPARA